MTKPRTQETQQQDGNSRKLLSVRLGMPWFTMWFFTIGIAKFGFLQGLRALVIWPYYLGDSLAVFIR